MSEAYPVGRVETIHHWSFHVKNTNKHSWNNPSFIKMTRLFLGVPKIAERCMLFMVVKFPHLRSWSSGVESQAILVRATQ